MVEEGVVGGAHAPRRCGLTPPALRRTPATSPNSDDVPDCADQRRTTPTASDNGTESPHDPAHREGRRGR